MPPPIPSRRSLAAHALALIVGSAQSACGEGAGSGTSAVATDTSDETRGAQSDATAGTTPGSDGPTGDSTVTSVTGESAGSSGGTTVGTDTGEFPATCRECPSEPCTRACLDPLGPEGPPEPGPYSGGACPDLALGGRNLGFGFNGRDVDIYVPTTTQGPYGVVFAWHGDGGSAADFGQALLGAHETDGYVLVVPDGQDRYDSQWQVEITPGVEGPAATDDLRFFDDVLACLWEQVPIDLRRVHSMGFSVGARFSAYLMGHRSDVVGSFVTWSGGDRTPQGIVVVPVATHPIPGLLYHGGVDDTPACCGMAPTQALAATMLDNGQYTIVCDHGQGHAFPPGDHAGQLWSFMLAHPFVLGAEAAWREAGLPGGFPVFCVPG
jgi:poly(3-hydroxybutyrate) depolymerase